LPISVVIPAYNSEAFIGETLDSVRAQSAPPSEVIVVDDGSADATSRVAAERGARVIRQANQGVSVARNTGVAAATGEWVAFLDSDDLWAPDKLEAQWEVVRTHPQIGFIFTDEAQFDAGGVTLESFFRSRPNYQRIQRRAAGPGIVLLETDSLVEGVMDGNFLVPSSWLVKRSLLEAAGPFNPALSGAGEDRELSLRLLRLSEAAAVERPLLRRRLRPGSVSTNEAKMHLGRARVAEFIAAQPERYPAPALTHGWKSRPLDLKRGGFQLLAEGRPREARAAFLQSFRARPSIKTLFLVLVSLAGPRLCRRVLASRQPPA
jgi:hypothetical protein